jgi:hypothetical protein
VGLLATVFAGFCLIANGAYIGIGAFDQLGDAGVMLRHGSPMWALLLFGAAMAPARLWLWHRQGPHFGMGSGKAHVSKGAAYGCLAVLVVLIVLGLVIDGA